MLNKHTLFKDFCFLPRGKPPYASRNQPILKFRAVAKQKNNSRHVVRLRGRFVKCFIQREILK